VILWQNAIRRPLCSCAFTCWVADMSTVAEIAPKSIFERVGARRLGLFLTSNSKHEEPNMHRAYWYISLPSLSHISSEHSFLDHNLSLVNCIFLRSFFVLYFPIFWSLSLPPPCFCSVYLTISSLYIFISVPLFSKSRDFLKSHFWEDNNISITLYMPSVQRSLYFFFSF
jgi:hypothetical protein